MVFRSCYHGDAIGSPTNLDILRNHIGPRVCRRKEGQRLPLSVSGPERSATCFICNQGKSDTSVQVMISVEKVL